MADPGDFDKAVSLKMLAAPVHAKWLQEVRVGADGVGATAAARVARRQPHCSLTHTHAHVTAV